MAKIFLESGDTSFIVANDDSLIYDSTGEVNTMVMNDGVTGVEVASTIEDIDFSGNFADYQFQQVDGTSNVVVLDGSGNPLVTLINTAIARTVSFADGTVEVGADLIGTDVVSTVGGVAITTTAAAVDTTDPDFTIDAGDVSSNAEGSTPGQTFTLTTGDDLSGTLVGSENTTSTDGDDIFNGTQTTYTNNDVILGGAGTDTLNITATTDIANIPTVAGVENINFNLEQFTNASWDIATDNIANGTITADVTQAGSSVNTVKFTGVKTGLTLSASDDFTTVNVAGIDNSQIVVNTQNTAAVTSTVTGATVDDITFNTAGNFTLSASSNDGKLTVDAAGTAAITGATATEADITATGALTLTSLDAATTITANGAGATSTLVAAAAVTTLNLAGNAAAHTLTITTGEAQNLANVNFTGDQDVTLAMSAADIAANSTALTTTDSTTGTSATTLQLADVGDGAATNLAGVVVDSIDVGVNTLNSTMTVGTGANVNFSTATQAASTVVTANAANAATNTVNLSVDNGIDTTAMTTTWTAGSVTNMKTVNLALSADDSFTTATSFSVGTADLVVTGTGAGALTLAGTTTANSIDASGMTGTGIATIALVGGASVGTVTTGSGADIINIADTALTAGTYTLDTGDGNDTINHLDSTGKQNLVINGGDGTDTLSFGTTDAVLTGKTLTTTSLEVIQIGGDASALTIDGSQLTGQSYIIVDNTGGSTVTANELIVTVDEATTDLSDLNVDAAGVGVTITGTTYSAVTGITVTGTNANDVILINGGKASTASGGEGADTITGGALVDTITGGEGGDTITGAVGNDVIDLTETAAALDTVKTTSGSAYGAANMDIITGFDAGSEATADTLEIDISDVVALASVTSLDAGDADTAVAGTDLVIQEIAVGTSEALVAGTEIVVMTDGVYANLAALQADITADGSTSTTDITWETVDAGGEGNSAFLLVYSDGTDSHVVAVADSDSATDVTLETADITITELVTLVGIPAIDAGDFAANNFDATA